MAGNQVFSTQLGRSTRRPETTAFHHTPAVKTLAVLSTVALLIVTDGR
jgi:hypothetical protein